MLRVGKASFTLPVVSVLLLAGCAADRSKQPAELTADSRLRVAEAAEQAGDRATALAMYSAAATDPHPDSQTRMRSAEGMARNGGLAEAESMLRDQLRSKPDDVDLLRTLGGVQIMSGNAPTAVVTLTTALEHQPNDVRAMTNKAVALDVLHRHVEAQQLYRKALAANPGDISISNDLALSLMLSGQRDEARELLTPFRNLHDLPDRVNANLGIIEAASGHDAEAQALLGGRVATTDLSSLTRAITQEQRSFRPDVVPPASARRVIVEPVVTGNDSSGRQPVAAKVHVESEPGQETATETVMMTPVVMRPESASASRRDRRPLQEQVGKPAVIRQDVARVPVEVIKPVEVKADAVRTPDAAPATIKPKPPVAPPPVTTSRDPAQDDLLPKRLRELPSDRNSSQPTVAREPLAAPPAAVDGTGSPAKRANHRPLQEETPLAAAAASPAAVGPSAEPGSAATAKAMPARRPLQEQTNVTHGDGSMPAPPPRRPLQEQSGAN